MSSTGSSDPDGTITRFEWREGAVTLGTGAVLTTTLGVGTHTVTLTVTDNKGATSTDTVVVTIVHPPPPPGNIPPVANAGPDQTVTDTDGDGIARVILNGTASFDPDGGISGYDWWEGAELVGAAFAFGSPFAWAFTPSR